jgi:putative colanic acid biosynthesis acetyltransferase WcaF
MNLAQYDNSHYDPGAGMIKRALWYVINAVLINSWLWPESRLKCAILRAFGAQIGHSVVIKPRVNIKYPWYLTLGNHVWLGEGVWLDCLARISIASNVCISQEAYLLTGNHNYKDPAFGLVVSDIHVEDEVWIGAKAVVCPGVRIKRGTVLTAGSILRHNSEEWGIYSGNPAIWVRRRDLAMAVSSRG